VSEAVPVNSCDLLTVGNVPHDVMQTVRRQRPTFLSLEKVSARSSCRSADIK
jgi:hypothetical protein